MEKGNLDAPERIILVGGSAGSFEIIFDMLATLKELRVPVLIILHRKGGVDSMLSSVMSGRSTLEVREAEEKDVLRNGTIYIAPADYHLLVESDKSLSLDDSEKVNYSRPSIDVSFESAAQVFKQKCVGLLLSGGNADGVNGLLAIKRWGGMCCVQDPATAELSFMPAQAMESMHMDRILKPAEIAGFLGSF